MKYLSVNYGLANQSGNFGLGTVVGGISVVSFVGWCHWKMDIGLIMFGKMFTFMIFIGYPAPKSAQ
jgi:hypothetical protein